MLLSLLAFEENVSLKVEIETRLHEVLHQYVLYLRTQNLTFTLVRLDIQSRENYPLKTFRFYMITGQYFSLNEILLGFNLLFALQSLGERVFLSYLTPLFQTEFLR